MTGWVRHPLTVSRWLRIRGFRVLRRLRVRLGRLGFESKGCRAENLSLGVKG